MVPHQNFHRGDVPKPFYVIRRRASDRELRGQRPTVGALSPSSFVRFLLLHLPFDFLEGSSFNRVPSDFFIDEDEGVADA